MEISVHVFFRNNIVVVFILSAPRSGSTWLNAVLGSNSWAGSLGEYYRPFKMPGHVACRMCEADGLSECTKLHGIQNIMARDAFHFAADRLGKSVLIDASKSLDWCKEFLGRCDIDAKLIHLVRNPCGFVESQGRRQAELSRDGLLDQWEDTNRTIEEFALASESSHIMVCYDDLADEPDTNFPRLCDFIGHEWQPEAINYWLLPHHGLGANGASSLYLRNRQRTIHQTGDDNFYAGLTERRTISDRRWIDRLPEDFCNEAISRHYAQYLQARLNSNWDRSRYLELGA